MAKKENRETESLLTASHNKAIIVNHIKAKIDKTQETGNTKSVDKETKR